MDLCMYVGSARSAKYGSAGYGCQPCSWSALYRKIYIFSVPIRAWEFSFARQVRPSRPASARSFFKLGLILIGWCLPAAFHPLFATASIYLYRWPPSGQSRVYQVTQLRTDGIHCRESAGTGPVNLKVVPNGCCLGRSPWINYHAPPFPTPTRVYYYWYKVWYRKNGAPHQTVFSSLYFRFWNFGSTPHSR